MQGPCWVDLSVPACPGTCSPSLGSRRSAGGRQPLDNFIPGGVRPPASRSPGHSDWHGSTASLPTWGESWVGFFFSFLFNFFFFFSTAQIFCSYKHSLEQCGRICRPSQRRIRKSLTWSENIVKKEQTAQSGDDLVNGSAGGGLEWVRVFSVRITHFLFFSFKIGGAHPVWSTVGKRRGNVSAL